MGVQHYSKCRVDINSLNLHDLMRQDCPAARMEKLMPRSQDL